MKTKLIALSLLLGLASCNKETLNYSLIDNIGDSEVTLRLNYEIQTLNKGDRAVFLEDETHSIDVTCKGDCLFRYNGAVYSESKRLK